MAEPASGHTVVPQAQFSRVLLLEMSTKPAGTWCGTNDSQAPLFLLTVSVPLRRPCRAHEGQVRAWSRLRISTDYPASFLVRGGHEIAQLALDACAVEMAPDILVAFALEPGQQLGEAFALARARQFEGTFYG